MQEAKFLKEILCRLDVLICLELEKPAATKNPEVASKIRRLAQMGLSASEVGAIVGKPANYVSATMSKHRKASAKKGEPSSG